MQNWKIITYNSDNSIFLPFLFAFQFFNFIDETQKLWFLQFSKRVKN